MDSIKQTSGWMCNVCACQTNTVFTLPCQHHFCEKCLNIWVGVYTDTYRPGHQEFPCRVCWQLHYTPKDGLTAYKQEMDICQIGIGLGNLSMETCEVSSVTKDTSIQNSHLPQQMPFAARTHHMPQVPNQSFLSVPLDNAQQQYVNENSASSENMDETGGGVLMEGSHNTGGVLSLQQLDTLNRNYDRKLDNPSLQSLPVLHDYGTMATNRLCYPTCHMYHMV